MLVLQMIYFLRVTSNEKKKVKEEFVCCRITFIENERESRSFEDLQNHDSKLKLFSQTRHESRRISSKILCARPIIFDLFRVVFSPN